jgi:hypothetical protein
MSFSDGVSFQEKEKRSTTSRRRMLSYNGAAGLEAESRLNANGFVLGHSSRSQRFYCFPEPRPWGSDVENLKMASSSIKAFSEMQLELKGRLPSRGS